MKRSTILLLSFVSCLLTGATAADSTRLWSFLRSNTDRADIDIDIVIDTVDTPYDDLLKCMWNGTTVAACHSMSCNWCHSSFADICVTAEYAANLDGSVFSCEGVSPDSDDDNAAADDDDAAPDDDDDSVTPVPTPAPTTDSPTPAPDDVLPIDDDGDPNHDANDKYEEKLLHCLTFEDSTCSSDASCTWCTFNGGGMCFSKQAAHQMDGSYYHCDDGTEESIFMTMSMD